MRLRAFIHLSAGVLAGGFMALPSLGFAEETGLSALFNECGAYPFECEVEDPEAERRAHNENIEFIRQCLIDASKEAEIVVCAGATVSDCVTRRSGPTDLTEARCALDEALIWDAVVMWMSTSLTETQPDLLASLSEDIAFRDATIAECGPEPFDLPRNETLTSEAGLCWAHAFALRAFELKMTETL